MKAFLSHSSRDKGTVETVGELLGGANIELDSVTFDRGILNVTAIQLALKRSALFVLFLSDSALKSPAVLFEALSAQEMQERGIIDRILIICLDEDSFSRAPTEWKMHNFVRKAVSTQSVARLIQSQLIAARSKASAADQPFVGRLQELQTTKEDLIKPKIARAGVVGTPAERIDRAR